VTTSRKPQGGGRERREEGRHHQDLGRRSHGHGEEAGPELYTAVIDEAHKNKLRVIAHIYTLDDAKATLRAGLDAFAHGVRDKDLDEEFLGLVKQRPNLVLGPNMPIAAWWLTSSGCGRHSRRSALRRCRRATPIGRTPRFWEIQARNLAKMNAPAFASSSAPTATLRMRRTSRWKTWWPRG
jgi:hypothetical protein